MEKFPNKYISKEATKFKDGKYYYLSRDKEFWFRRAKECQSYAHFVIGATLTALEAQDTLVEELHSAKNLHS